MIYDGRRLQDGEWLRMLADWGINCDFEMVNEPLAALSPQPSGNAITKVSAHTAVGQNNGWLTSEWRKEILAGC